MKNVALGLVCAGPGLTLCSLNSNYLQKSWGIKSCFDCPLRCGKHGRGLSFFGSFPPALTKEQQCTEVK